MTAKASVDSPMPARVEDIKSDNPHGGQLLAHALKREGVSRLFALIGGQTFPIFDGCLDEGIEVLDTRHEQAVGHVAEGWSWVTGEVSVMTVTAGPGITNAVPGIVHAHQDGVPMLILGGRIGLREMEQGTCQDVDQVELLKSITKYQMVCYETKRIPEYVAMAFRHALGGRPGPVYLEIPADVLNSRVAKSEARFPVNYRAIERPRGSRASIDRAVKILSESKRPAILAGGGCRWAHSRTALKNFVERTGIPFASFKGGRGVLPDSHPLSLFPAFQLPGSSGKVQPDALLFLGERFDYQTGNGRAFPGSTKIIQVDIDASVMGFNRGADCAIVGDITQVLEDLQSALPKTPNRPWGEEAKQLVKEFLKADRSKVDYDAVPCHPCRVVEEMVDIGGTDTSFIIDGGYAGQWGQATFPAEQPGDAGGQTSGPMGYQGVGLPFAIGVKAANPDRNVMVISGDGSFGFNCVEMDTALRHKLPVVVVVINDGAWGMIKRGQIGVYGADRLVASELGFMRYDKWVEGFGGYGELVEKPGDIRPAIERAVASGLPACVNVICQTVPRYG